MRDNGLTDVLLPIDMQCLRDNELSDIQRGNSMPHGSGCHRFGGVKRPLGLCI